MPRPLLLRTFVNERLSAAAEEIIQVFESTIAKYEEEASSSKQENERLRGLLREVMSKQKAEPTQLSVYKEHSPLEQSRCEQEPSTCIHQGDPELRHIKEEDHELWAGLQQEEQQAVEFKDADVLFPLQNEQENTKLSFHSHMQNCERGEVFQQLQDTKTVKFPDSVASSQTLVHNVPEGRESDRYAASFTSEQTQTEQSPSFATTREPTDLSFLNSDDYRCYLCSRAFSSNLRLINHAFQEHSKNAGVLCAVCGTSLESSESLSLHLKSHKGSKCCVCGKHFKSRTSLTEHMAGHSGVKLHRCHVCGRECSRKGDLKIHMRIHTGEKPFCCSVCCKGFTHSGHLKKHMRSHTGERPHHCDVCGRGFLQSAHLKYHLKTHTQKH
ncbi:zinc finger protein 8-like [Mugil cephalus]|uniref:zinc finger protein 8-like n=1 Tax=Mugil cephalus TaxID=48193 RepID=UPI001FB641E2|nr:zinc finger protein 8-like [Mugil cephalus]